MPHASSPRRRQIDTARHLQEAAGRIYPDMRVVPGFDEYPAIEILRHAAVRLSADDPAFAEHLGFGSSVAISILPRTRNNKDPRV